jgi:hypothetical protein
VLKCDVILEAPAPWRPVDRGLAGAGLLAHVLVGKYADHLPLYRQSEIYAREGVDLDRPTLADRVGLSSYLVSSLVHQIRSHVLAASKLHADDTPVPVLAPGMGRTKTARLWTYVRDDRPAADDTPPAVWFATRKIVKASVRSSTSQASPASFKPMAMRVFIISTKADGSSKLPTDERSLPKRSSVSVRSMTSNARFAATLLRPGPRSGRHALVLCSMSFIAG